MRGVVLLFAAALGTAQVITIVPSGAIRPPGSGLAPGSIAGRVVDDQGAPAANVKVELLDPRGGAPIRLTTDDEGRFHSGRLFAARYVARIVGATPHILEATGDSGLVEQLARDSYWGGGTDSLATALPLNLAPGSFDDFGTLRIATAPHYRVRVRVAKPGERADCETPASLTIARKGAPVLTLPVACAREFVVGGLTAGSYTFGLYYGVESQQWALENVELRHEGQEVEMLLAPMGRVTGRLVPAEGATLEGLRYAVLNLQPEIAGLPTLVPDANASADGRFEFPTVAWPLHKLTPVLARGYYVQSIRAGRADGWVPMTPGGVSSVEVVVDNQGATLNGAIATGAGTVYLIGGKSLLTLSGQFAFHDLPPGDYRVIALPLGVGPDPERQASYAIPVALKRGETKTIQLRLTELPR